MELRTAHPTKQLELLPPPETQQEFSTPISTPRSTRNSAEQEELHNQDGSHISYTPSAIVFVLVGLGAALAGVFIGLTYGSNGNPIRRLGGPYAEPVVLVSTEVAALVMSCCASMTTTSGGCMGTREASGGIAMFGGICGYVFGSMVSESQMVLALKLIATSALGALCLVGSFTSVRRSSPAAATRQKRAVYGTFSEDERAGVEVALQEHSDEDDLKASSCVEQVKLCPTSLFRTIGAVFLLVIGGLGLGLAFVQFVLVLAIAAGRWVLSRTTRTTARWLTEVTESFKYETQGMNG